MRDINKSYIYECLNNLHDRGIDVTNYIAKMVGSDFIPYEVIVFVNSHQPIEKLTTYNEIHSKRNKSPLFRNIVSKDLTIDEQAIVLSSILNQSLISLKHFKSDSRGLIDAINAETIITALRQYLYENDDAAITDAFNMFRTIFKTLFPK